MSDETTAVATLTTEQLATIASETFDDQSALENYIADLPAERVPLVLARTMALRRWLQQIEKMAESRMGLDQILTSGEFWTDPDTAVEFMFTGDRKREVKDPEGLRAALAEIVMRPLADRAYRAAFRVKVEVMLRELDEMVKFAPQTGDIVRDFTAWKEGPLHLRPVEEKT